MLTSHRSSWQSGLLWSGVALLAIGFVAERAWESLPGKHAAELLAITAIAMALSFATCKFLRVALADALLAIFAIALVAFAGPLPVSATLLLAVAALGLGARISGTRGGTVGIVAGLGLIAGVLGWLLPVPLHFRFVYFFALALIAVFACQRVFAAMREAASAWRGAVDAEPAIAAFAVLVIGLASVGCWIPTVQFDDLAYHLGLPAQLAKLHYYRMDMHSQIWALAPWSGDIVQAIAQLVAGSEARGAVDALWLVLLVTLAWQLAAALDLPMRARWLCAALVASQPMTAALAGGMQAELPATAAAFALALTVARTDARKRDGVAFAILAGLLLALKTGFIALILPLLIVWLWRRRGAFSLRALSIALALFVLVGGSCYAYDGFLTGNPLFPIGDGLFHSPLLAGVDIHDDRWAAPVTWDLPWRLVFRTREYSESWNGTAGFSLLALLGAVPIALAQHRVRWLALCALAAFVAAIATVHYFRYGYAALMLLTPCLIAAVFVAASARAAVALLASVIVLNLAWQGSAFWTLHSGAITREVTQLSRAPVYATFAPERLLVEYVREHDPSAHVIFCAREHPFAAELAGAGFTIAHYDPQLHAEERAAEEDASGSAWRKIFAQAGARYAITHDDDTTPALRAALSDAQLVQQANTSQLWRLPAQTTGALDLEQQRDEAAAHFRP